MALNKRLINNSVKYTFSRTTLKSRVKYGLLSIVFIPIMLIEGRSNNGKSDKVSENSLTGDDIYPLF